MAEKDKAAEWSWKTLQAVAAVPRTWILQCVGLKEEVNMVQKHSVREKQTWTRMETGQADIRLKIYVDDRSNNTNFM